MKFLLVIKAETHNYIKPNIKSYTNLGSVLIFDLQLYAPGRLTQISPRLHVSESSSHSSMSVRKIMSIYSKLI